jgi:hypothetical protein
MIQALIFLKTDFRFVTSALEMGTVHTDNPLRTLKSTTSNFTVLTMIVTGA